MKKMILQALFVALSLQLVAQNTMFLETFESSSGQFGIENITIPSGTDYVWKHDVYKMDGFMKGNAGIDGAQASEAWLISSAIDLSSATTAALDFDHAASFQNGTVAEEFTVWVSTTASELFNADEWTQLTIPTFPAAGSWTFVSSGAISLDDYVGAEKAPIKIAFRYKTTSAVADAWEISRVTITGDGTPIPPELEPVFVAANIEFASDLTSCDIALVTDMSWSASGIPTSTGMQINYNSYVGESGDFVGTFVYDASGSGDAGTFSMLGSLIKQFDETGSLSGETLMNTGSLTVTDLGDSLYRFDYSATNFKDKTYSGSFSCKPTIVKPVTAIKTVQSELNVYTCNGQIVVPTEVGKRIVIYNMMGQEVYTGVAQGSSTIIKDLPIQQVLVVRVGNKIAKVIL